jgi:hypothetical protein
LDLGSVAAVYNDSILQTISIPSNAVNVTLSYKWRVSSTEPTNNHYDYATVRVRNTAGANLALLAEYWEINESANWQTASHSLNAYKGQTVQIRFASSSDASSATDFMFDNISVLATFAPSSPTPSPSSSPSPSPSPSQAPSISNRYAITTASTNLRSNTCDDAGCTIIATYPAETIGTLVAGPLNSDGYTWYRVNISGTEGWMADGTLDELVVAFNSTPPNTTSPTSYGAHRTLMIPQRNMTLKRVACYNCGSGTYWNLHRVVGTIDNVTDDTWLAEGTLTTNNSTWWRGTVSPALSLTSGTSYIFRMDNEVQPLYYGTSGQNTSVINFQKYRNLGSSVFSNGSLQIRMQIESLE